MQEGRLFRIVYQLLEKGQVTVPQLAQKLEVSERTISRDIDALSEAGIPVYVERGRNGGVRLLDDFVLNRELLSEGERRELLAALQSLEAVGAYDTAILQKLSALFKSASEEWCEVDFSRWGEQTQDNEKFELFKRAVIYRRCVWIVYAGSRGEEDERKVCPLKLLYKSKAWYLKAWCTKKMDFRLFKLNRILRWEMLEEEFEPIAWSEAGRESQTVPPKKFQAGEGLRTASPEKLQAEEEHQTASPKKPQAGEELQTASPKKPQAGEESRTASPKKSETGGESRTASSKKPEKEKTSEAVPLQEQPQEIVRLRFPKEVAFRVYDEFDEKQVKREENGDFLVSAPMPVDAWVLAFLLSFGTQVEVLEPPYLKELLKDKVMELYEKYKE